MKAYADYIERNMQNHPNDDLTFTYKRNVLEAMLKRKKQLQTRGISDENVIRELIFEENRAIEEGYYAYLEDQKDKKRIKNLPRNIALYMLGLVAVYLGVGFLTHVWHPTWLIIEGGVSFMVIYLLLFLASHLTDTVLYPLVRLCVAGSVMMATQFVFLVMRLPFGIENSYLLFLGAIAVMLLADGILASVTKQKFAFLSWLIYIPACMGLIYPLLGLTGVIAWNPGWLLMVAAVAFDVLLVVGTVLYKGRYSIKQELENIWKEN